MYKSCSNDASLVVRLSITFMGVKAEKKAVVIYYLQASALIWRFKICIDHVISICSILRNIVWHCPTIDSVLVDWKLTILSFFLHSSLILKYANSLYQCDFFRHCLLVLEIQYLQSNQSNKRDRKKTFATRANFFSSMLFFFSSRVCF